MTPDGPPVLGYGRHGNLLFNVGHGHMGWTMACGTARIVADLLAGRRPELDLKAWARGPWPEGVETRSTTGQALAPCRRWACAPVPPLAGQTTAMCDQYAGSGRKTRTSARAPNPSRCSQSMGMDVCGTRSNSSVRKARAV